MWNISEGAIWVNRHLVYYNKGEVAFMKKSEVAVQCLTSGFNCAQAVFSAHCSELGLKSETALRIAAGFGGGMGISETCGAVTDAFMLIGLKYRNINVEDKVNKRKTNSLVYQDILSK